MELFIGLSRLLGKKLVKMSYRWVSDLLRFVKWYYTPDGSETYRWNSAMSARAAMIARFFRVIF